MPDINSFMKYIIVMSLVLAGCTAKFNQTNYDRMVDVAAITGNSDAVCATTDSMQANFIRIYNDTVYALEDAAGRSDNDLVKMLTEQFDEINRFKSMMSKGTVSQIYCKQKVNNIYNTARLIAKSEGNKLKLL
jgi:hypothetical protein